MAIVTISGETGCRSEDFARAAAHRLGFQLISDSRLTALLRDELGEVEIPDRVWAAAATAVLSRVAVQHHIVISATASEALFPKLVGTLRVLVQGRAAHRMGAIMLDRRLDRAGAGTMLRTLEREDRAIRKARCGRSLPAASDFDCAFNSENFQPEQAADVIAAAVNSRGLLEDGLLSPTVQSQIEFQARLQLAKFGIVPAGKAAIQPKIFGHPSEELFANLLDFYRIAWDYEPRSFPLQWDREGRVTEAFTPDFYLPESDLYVELTTMKQALVTKKNRKIKLLRAIYPHVNIQVFYQKDFQDLVSKHGLADRVIANDV